MRFLLKKHFIALFSSFIAFINSMILAYRAYVDMGTAPSASGIILALYAILSVASLSIFIIEAKTLFRERKRTIKINDKTKITTIKYKDKISKYLIDFIVTGGDIVIVSRNLSWITKDVMWRMEAKAKAGELTVFIPSPDREKISEELKKLGADVRYYGGLVDDDATWFLETRFTIAQWRSSSKRMTFPKTLHEYHYNHESIPNEPTMDLALDLVRLLDRATAAQAKRRKGTGAGCETIEMITATVISEIQSMPYERENYAKIINTAKQSFSSCISGMDFHKPAVLAEVLTAMRYNVEETGENFVVARCQGQNHLFYCNIRPQKRFKEYPLIIEERIDEHNLTKMFYMHLMSVIAKHSDVVMHNPAEHAYISGLLSL